MFLSALDPLNAPKKLKCLFIQTLRRLEKEGCFHVLPLFSVSEEIDRCEKANTGKQLQGNDRF